jgi:hypothetical protein
MLKTRFEAQQYLIRQAEIKLHNDTQILLTEMLRSLSEVNLIKLDYYCLENCSEHSLHLKKVEIFSDSIIIIVKDTYDSSIRRYSIECLTQSVQKGLIDFIIKNNLVSN